MERVSGPTGGDRSPSEPARDAVSSAEIPRGTILHPNALNPSCRSSCPRRNHAYCRSVAKSTSSFSICVLSRALFRDPLGLALPALQGHVHASEVLARIVLPRPCLSELVLQLAARAPVVTELGARCLHVVVLLHDRFPRLPRDPVAFRSLLGEHLAQRLLLLRERDPEALARAPGRVLAASALVEHSLRLAQVRTHRTKLGPQRGLPLPALGSSRGGRPRVRLAPLEVGPLRLVQGDATAATLWASLDAVAAAFRMLSISSSDFCVCVLFSDANRSLKLRYVAALSACH